MMAYVLGFVVLVLDVFQAISLFDAIEQWIAATLPKEWPAMRKQLRREVVSTLCTIVINGFYWLEFWAA